MMTLREEKPTQPKKAERAVALRYDERESSTPKVVASGVGEIAQHILAVAKQHGVPVREDPDLVTLLAVCDLGEEIPVELYEAVAELLTFLYRINESLR
jgi:flagellar biosynthesis protein